MKFTKINMNRPMPVWKTLATSLMLFGLLIVALGARAESESEETIVHSHGYSFFGDLKYPADYSHFDYVNPDAPKGGEISFATTGTFDSMNPYARKGRAGVLSSMIYESLLGEGPGGESVPSDVYGESYGLLAERLEYDAGKTWVIFYMRKEARFSDGSPVTAHDVVFSHYLFLDQGLPSYAAAVKKIITSAEALDDHTVKFTFALDIPRRSLIDQAGGVPVFSKAWYERTGARLDESRLEISPGSGPYVLDGHDINRRITYRRDPEYWGADLAFNVGRNNFDTIRVEYFGDSVASLEAFKAGIYTFHQESSSKNWATGYDFPAVEKGHVTLEELKDGNPPSATGIVFNLTRDVMKDVRVRKAITLAYNFEWTNESLQFGLFRQRQSYAQGLPFMAMGAPEGAELALLQSYGDLVQEEMLNEPAVVAHTSKPGRLNDRRNLRVAMKLLDEAGWEVGDDGMRRNAKGEVLRLDFPIPSSSGPTLGAIIESFVQNLKIVGVEVNYEKIDPAQFTLRRRERDYDLAFTGYSAFMEAGTGLMQRFGSQAAAVSVFNPAGLASPLVDAIIDTALETTTRADQDVALMALDRALRHERMMIPTWFNGKYWVAYWDIFEHPDELPAYALGELDFWWYNAEKHDALKASGALR